MPNITSAKKRARQTIKKHARNLRRRSAIKTAIKRVVSAVELKDAAQAKEFLRDVSAQLSRAKSKGVMHPNTAARKLSRLAKRVAVLERPA